MWKSYAPALWKNSCWTAACGQRGKVIHHNCGKASTNFPVALDVENSSTRLWENGRLEDRFVDDVEKLSTAIVNKSAVRLVPVDGVEKLSTAIVENSTGVLKRKKR